MKISVITPVYNGGQFVESCILNVISQNCSCVEHIIVDGGSTDNTISIIEKYTKDYTHIRWISEKDRGQSDAMNKGIRMAEGDIINFLNVDDYFEPNTLTKVLQIFKDLPEPSLLAGNCKVWDINHNIMFISKPNKIGFLNMFKSWDAFPNNPSAYFYHKSLHNKTGMYDEEEHFVMDIDFMMRAVQHAHLKYVDIHFGNWRVLPGTKSFEDNKIGLSPLRQEAVLKKYMKDLPLFQRWYIQLYRTNRKLVDSLERYRKRKDIGGIRKIIRTGKYYTLNPSKIYSSFLRKVYSKK